MYHVEFPGLGIEVNINPDAFSVGSYTIRWYGILIAVGFLLAFIYAMRSCKAMKIDQNRLVDVVIVGVILGIIGARLYYVLFYPGSTYRDDPIKILYITEGGLAIYGGVIGGLLGGAIMAKIRKVSIPAVLDVASLGFLIGQAIGRWGNFINQEAFGTKTDNFLRMQSEATLAEVEGAAHPCFLYESVWCILGFILLHLFTRKLRRYDGQTFLLYIVWYGIGRFFIEGLRTDSLIVFSTIRVSQLVAAVSVFISIILLLVFRNRTKLTGCGKKEIMLLNSMSDSVPGAEDEAQFGTIFGSLGYEEPDLTVENAVEDVGKALEKVAQENAEASENAAEEAKETADEAAEAIEETAEAAEETAEDVVEETKETVEEAAEAAEETAEAAEEAVEAVAEEAKETVEEAAEAAEETAEAAEEAVEAAAEEVKETVEEAAEAAEETAEAAEATVEEKAESLGEKFKKASETLNAGENRSAEAKAEKLESAIAELEAALDAPARSAQEVGTAAAEILQNETKPE